MGGCKGKNFRKIADEIYGKFPFFAIAQSEFLSRCLALQRCGAGIVLGYGKSGFDVRVIAVPGEEMEDRVDTYKNLPLGHFGEIVFSQSGTSPFSHTGLYGFFDQRMRIWCCGKIEDTAFSGGRRYFPYCIEPLFERIFWVERAKFCHVKDKEGNALLRMSIVPVKIFLPLVKNFRRYFHRKLEKFAKKFAISKNIKIFTLES
jgi:hypothetical protein